MKAATGEPIKEQRFGNPAISPMLSISRFSTSVMKMIQDEISGFIVNEN